MRRPARSNAPLPRRPTTGGVRRRRDRRRRRDTLDHRPRRSSTHTRTAPRRRRRVCGGGGARRRARGPGGRCDRPRGVSGFERPRGREDGDRPVLGERQRGRTAGVRAEPNRNRGLRAATPSTPHLGGERGRCGEGVASRRSERNFRKARRRRKHARSRKELAGGSLVVSSERCAHRLWCTSAVLLRLTSLYT